MDSTPSSKVLKTGFLKKRSKYLHLWKTRFCVLTDKPLFAFTGIEKDADCTMTLLLDNCKDVNNTDQDLGKENTFSINATNLTYYFQAENEKERNEWKSTLEHIISKNNNNPLYI